ncbi:DUF1249 domain-containing protein [Marinicella rhabdoformis]|uniref:DUF1249 domain-containing protein n=1 Tax=Marinicella rhabdoformis TaxID=2580566 RepID=UPI0012AEBBEA|nr:DUF1249 domain-containing protein [Marinicella rhabdoformis]
MLLNSQFLEHRQLALKNKVSITVLHEYNYLLLNQLFSEWTGTTKVHHWQPKNKAKLQLRVRENFKYTTEFSMAMLFSDATSDPMVVRIYHDAQLAELVYSNEFERQYRQLGGLADTDHQAELRFSQNCFLNKWLIFLLQNGYHKEKVD